MSGTNSAFVPKIRDFRVIASIWNYVNTSRIK
jgi:hypothetical protein